MSPVIQKKPEWLRVKIQGGAEASAVKNLISDLNLHTVCVEANCPNRMECYNRKTATFMILGRFCTRNCAFCNVTNAMPSVVDPNEPQNVAEAVKRLGLKYAVITSVTRDDLDDGGAGHFAAVGNAIKALTPDVRIEYLIPDLQGSHEALKTVLDSRPDVLNHNIETVPALYDTVRPQASYQQSLELLQRCKAYDPQIQTKSGIMLGLGETVPQVIEVLKDLRAAGCDILTVGQYLQPSPQHYPMKAYIPPEVFSAIRDEARALGFESVASAPLVRSSYHADELARENN